MKTGLVAAILFAAYCFLGLAGAQGDLMTMLLLMSLILGAIAIGRYFWNVIRDNNRV